MTDKDSIKFLKFYGERAKQLREEKNWSQKGLADTAGLHKSVISDIENGKKEVCFVNRHKLYKGLGVTEYEFHDTPELRRFTGAPATKHQRFCPMAQCRMLCWEREEEEGCKVVRL